MQWYRKLPWIRSLQIFCCAFDLCHLEFVFSGSRMTLGTLWRKWPGELGCFIQHPSIHPLLAPGPAFWTGLKCRGEVLKASLHQVKITTTEYCNYYTVTSSNICFISAHNKGEPLSSDCRISPIFIVRVSSSVIRRSRRRKPKSRRIRREDVAEVSEVQPGNRKNEPGTLGWIHEWDLLLKLETITGHG